MKERPGPSQFDSEVGTTAHFHKLGTRSCRRHRHRIQTTAQLHKGRQTRGIQGMPSSSQAELATWEATPWTSPGTKPLMKGPSLHRSSGLLTRTTVLLLHGFVMSTADQWNSTNTFNTMQIWCPHANPTSYDEGLTASHATVTRTTKEKGRKRLDRRMGSMRWPNIHWPLLWQWAAPMIY